MWYLLRGILIGLIFGLPDGAVGALTMQHTFRYGGKAGLLTGLGSSVADCFYACVGVFGLTLISDFLMQYQTVITVLGGSLILLMGIHLLLKQGTADTQQQAVTGYARMFLSSFMVGITNPAAILTFLFAFSYFGISGKTALLQGMLLVCGIFLGTYAWWGALTAVSLTIRKKTTQFRLDYMDRIFGTILCMFGVVLFMRLAL